MANWRHRRLLRQAWHPADEELLLYVEGESDARGARRLSDHLSGCWTCRARRDEIERAIGAYMAYDRDRARATGAGGGDPEQATRHFAAALARASEAQHDARPALAAGLVPGWVQRWKRRRADREHVEPFALATSVGGRRWSWTVARAAAVVLAIVLVMRSWSAPTPVSARELIARVDRAQQQEIAAVADAVIYQRLHASRTSANVPRASSNDTVTWEVWSSQRQRRIVERVSASSPLLLDLQAVLRENGMEPGQPLSAASLTAWRRFAGHVAEDVRETKLSDGTPVVTLTSSAPGPVGEGRITRSEVIVRTRDWHPVTHILTVAGAAGEQQRYTITELNYRVVPFETVDATIFNPPAIAPSVPADDAGADASAAPPAPAIHPAHAALVALYEAHTTGACLRDRGFVEPTASDNGNGGSNARVGSDGVDTAVRHLWAIRQLAEWYRATERDGLERARGRVPDRGLDRGLDRKSASLLATMIREHLDAARQLLPASDEAASAEPTVATAGEPWTTVAMKAYAAVEYASRAAADGGGEARQNSSPQQGAGAQETARGAAADGGGEVRQNVSARQDAVARARALLRSLDAAVQRLATDAAPGVAPPTPDAPGGVTRRPDRP